MCSCDGLGPDQPSLESGLYVPRVTDWNLKMMPNLMKKPVSRMFLKLRLSVHCIVTDLQADFDCRNDPICPEFLKEILKTLTQKATYYTLSGRFRDILIWKTPIVCSDHAAEQRVVKERRN